MSQTASYIEITPDTCFGKPRITGTRITVADIALMYLSMGQSLEEIAGKYSLSLASIHAAMSYYYEHREEIEQRRIQEDNLIKNMQQNYSCPLEEKLQVV